MIEDKFVADILTTRKIRKKKNISEQSIKDSYETEIRMEKNGVKIDLVEAVLENIYGKKYTVEQIRVLAMGIARKISKKLDRLAHRNKNALLCWFSENWDQVYPYLYAKFQKKPKFIGSKDNFSENLLEKTYIDPSDLSQLLNTH